MYYIVSLNQNAEHLGTWDLTFDATVATHTKWLNYKCYFMGDFVNHLDKIYKANTNHCVSQPGNKTHEKFYLIFSKPFRIVSMLLLIKVWCFITVIALAFINRRWYTIVINIIEVLLNSHTFFILCRDFFILYYNKNLKINKKFNWNFNFCQNHICVLYCFFFV